MMKSKCIEELVGGDPSKLVALVRRMSRLGEGHTFREHLDHLASDPKGSRAVEDVLGLTPENLIKVFEKLSVMFKAQGGDPWALADATVKNVDAEEEQVRKELWN